MTNKKFKIKLRKRKNIKMRASLLSKLAYELLPTNDEALLAIDEDIAQL
jgi:hypothetical protein